MKKLLFGAALLVVMAAVWLAYSDNIQPNNQPVSGPIVQKTVPVKPAHVEGTLSVSIGNE